MRALAYFAMVTVTRILLAAPHENVSKASTKVEYSRLTWKAVENCPVEFSARRQSPTDVVEVSSASHTSGQGVRLTLKTFAHLSAAAIVAADVDVHAASNRTRYLPLEDMDPESDLSETFHLSAPKDRGELRSSNLWLARAGSILSVDLVSLTFADGSVWKHSSSSTCHAVVSGYMLVSSR